MIDSQYYYHHQDLIACREDNFSKAICRQSHNHHYYSFKRCIEDSMLVTGVVLAFLIHQQHRCANAARCEGTLKLNSALKVCNNFFNETTCSHENVPICLWDSVNGCVLRPRSPCSTLHDHANICNSTDGCYWAEVPVWIWLAINIPLWLAIAVFCLICYHKHVGPSALGVHARSDSMTIENSSQFTEEQQEPVSDTFQCPVQVSFAKNSTESETSSNESNLIEIEMEEADAELDQLGGT